MLILSSILNYLPRKLNDIILEPQWKLKSKNYIWHLACPFLVQFKEESWRMDQWLLFYVIFNSISVMSGQWLNSNDRLCAMEPCLQSERFPPQAGLEYGTARSVGQRLTYWATGDTKRWMDDFGLYVLFNSISVKLRQCLGDNERLYALEPHWWLERFPCQLRLEPMTARSVGQHQ